MSCIVILLSRKGCNRGFVHHVTANRILSKAELAPIRFPVYTSRILTLLLCKVLRRLPRLVVQQTIAVQLLLLSHSKLYK